MIEHEQFCALPKNGVVRGKSWTRQTLSDAWESTSWGGLCGTPWQMVALELKLTQKVKADKEGAGPPLPRIVVEIIPEAEPEEVVRFVQRWQRMEERSNHTMTIVENESERSLREP